MGIPSPSENAELWDTVTIGPGILPPVASEGTAEIKVRAKAKLDTKGKGSAGKPTTTKTGRELAEVTVTLRFNEAIWPEVEAALLLLQPGAGPFKIGHPKTRLAGVESVSIESYEGPDWDDYQVGTIVWNCKEWAPPPVEAVKKDPKPAETSTESVPLGNKPWAQGNPDVRTANKGVAALFRHAADKAVFEAGKP